MHGKGEKKTKEAPVRLMNYRILVKKKIMLTCRSVYLPCQ